MGEKSCGQGSAGFEELATVGGDRWLLHFGDLGAANALLRANYMARGCIRSALGLSKEV